MGCSRRIHRVTSYLYRMLKPNHQVVQVIQIRVGPYKNGGIFPILPNANGCQHGFHQSHIVTSADKLQLDTSRKQQEEYKNRAHGG